MSNVRVDQEQILNDLIQVLSSSTAWNDLLTTSTGTAIMEMISTQGTFGVFAAERALQEAYSDSSRLASSIYSGARLLGTRLTRMSPSSCTIQVTKPANITGYYTIPSLTTITSSTVSLFIRDPIVFRPTDTSITVNAYTGTLVTKNTLGTGAPSQVFISSEENFTISDQDVWVKVANRPIPVVTDGLWRYQAIVDATTYPMTIIPVDAVQDRTTKNGELELNFGNDKFGTMPSSGDAVTITYAVTGGSSDDNANFGGTTLSINGYPQFTAVATSALTGGGDPPSPETYRSIVPGLYSAQSRAVNENEYNSLAAAYPGVIDAQIYGQRHIAPNNVQWMNMLRICLLTQSTFSSTDQANFETYLRNNSMAYMNYTWTTPVQQSYNISVDVYCTPTAPLNDIQASVTEALVNLTKIGFGSLGDNLYLSDVYNSVMTADTRVLYCVVNSPQMNTIASPTIPSITVTKTTGVLPADNYTFYYAIAQNGTWNDSIPDISAQMIGTSNCGFTFTWTPEDTGTFVLHFYVKDSGGTGYIGQATPQSGTFTWTGSIAADNTHVPATIDTSPVRYLVPGTMTVNVFYASDRANGQQ